MATKNTKRHKKGGRKKEGESECGSLSLFSVFLLVLFCVFCGHCSLEQLPDDVPARAEAERRGLLAGDADAVVDRRGEVGRRDGQFVRPLGALVALADHAAATDAAAGHQGAVAVLPMLAAGLVVDLRRP